MRWDDRGTRKEIQEGWERTLAPLKRISGADSMEVIFHIQSKIIPKEYGYLRTQTTLEEGLSAIRSIRKEEIPRLHARDPHELMRCLEAQNLAEVGELILTVLSIGRKAGAGTSGKTSLIRTTRIGSGGSPSPAGKKRS